MRSTSLPGRMQQRNVSRRKQGGGRGNGSGSRFHQADEFLTFSLALGSTQNITLGNVSTRPSGCNFRPLFLQASLTTAYVPALANDSLQGYFTPSAIDIQLCAGPNGGDVISTSRPQILGSNPRSVRVRYPRSGDWYPYNKATSTIIARVNAVCLGNPGVSVTAYLRGVLHLRYQFSFEVLTAVCPTHLSDTDPLPLSLGNCPEDGFVMVKESDHQAGRSLTSSQDPVRADDVSDKEHQG